MEAAHRRGGYPMRLHFYFGRKFLFYFFGLTFGFFVLLVLIDLIEEAQRFEAGTVSFGEVLGLTLLKTPTSMYTIMPLIAVLSALALFLALSRSSELVVTRSAGRSALVALWAPFILMIVIGVALITVLNPIVAATSERYQALSDEYIKGETAVFSISSEGLWLRQGSPAGQTVIHATAANHDGSSLFNVTLITFAQGGGPIRRIEAETARLEDGYWRLFNAKSWPLVAGLNPEVNANEFATLRVPSTLTRENMSDSLGEPSSVAIWDMSEHINALENAGFSARRHKVWFQMELARPLFLASMVLVGAGFTMRHTRFGHTGLMVLIAVLIAFGLYFIRNFAQILGENGQIPVLWAAWTPPIAGTLLALGIILNMEDG